MDTDQPKKTFKLYKADKSLQAKTNTVFLDEKAIERAQHVIESNKVDFAPLAQEYLDDLEQAIKTAKTGEQTDKKIIQDLTAPVMQLKANAVIFHYTLVGNLANIMLGFMEHVKTLDNDAISIITSYHQTIKAIIKNKMTGDGGDSGQAMALELKAACKRYFDRHK